MRSGRIEPSGWGEVIVVVGLAFEARIAAGPGMRVICGGDGRDLTARIARAIAQGCQGLVSFGVAGGIAPELKPGDCVVASAVLSGKSLLPTDPQWSQRLLQIIPNPVHGTVLGVPATVADPADKRDLYLRTGAVAVDMESHVVAKVAAEHQLPMAAIRVITDPARRALPKCAATATRADGTIDVGAVFRSLLRQPSELVTLFQSALDTRAAYATLRRGRELLGPGLGLPEFQGDELVAEPARPIGRWRAALARGFGAYLPTEGAFQNAE
jgi:hopanoid-associated phosphorylase